MSNRINRGGTRGRDTGDSTYSPPQRLAIPEETTQRFLDEGFYLRWIRVRIRNEEDISNVSTRLQEGFSFVKPEEVEELVQSLRLTVNSNSGLVVNGDLALAKIKIADSNARQEYFEDMARVSEAAHMKDLERQSDRRMPIYNDSRSHTRTGRSAEFAKD